MATLKKYDLQGKETGTVTVADELANAEVNSQLVKDYIVAIRKNKRQWSASTKGRSEVAHTTKKPHKQKGTGNARHGNLVGPQFRGGGIVFGPKPKFDQHTRINKKERLAAIKGLLGEMIRNGSVCILETTKMDTPQTKTVASFLKQTNIEGRTLFLGEGNFQEIETDGNTKSVSVKQSQHENFRKSLSNIPKVTFALASNINGYDVMVNSNIVLTEDALNEISTWLTK